MSIAASHLSPSRHAAFTVVLDSIPEILYSMGSYNPTRRSSMRGSVVSLVREDCPCLAVKSVLKNDISLLCAWDHEIVEVLMGVGKKDTLTSVRIDIDISLTSNLL